MTNQSSCIGHTYRIRVVNRLTKHMKASGARFAKMGDVAKSIRAQENL